MKLNGKMKKVFALLLCLCMLAQYVPTAVITPASAEGGVEESDAFNAVGPASVTVKISPKEIASLTLANITGCSAETLRFTLKDGETVIPESDKTPDTGNKSKPALYAALAVLSLGALIALIFVQRKTKK